MAYFFGLEQKDKQPSVVLVRLNLQTGASSVVQIPGEGSPWAIYRSSDALLVPNRRVIEVYSLKTGQFIPQTIPCVQLDSSNGFVVANGKSVYEWEEDGVITQIATDELKPVAKAIPWQLGESVLSVNPSAAAGKTENLLVLAAVVDKKGNKSTEKSKLLLVDPASQKILFTRELPFLAKPPLVMSSDKQRAWIINPKGHAIVAIHTRNLEQMDNVPMGVQLGERQWKDMQVLGDSSR